MDRGSEHRPNGASLAKVPSGIIGLDQITGGLPAGRTVLVAGGPGCGKTLLAMEFLVRGVQEYGEPGVFVSFEESAQELTQNVASFGWDLKKLEAEHKFLIDQVVVDRSEIEETGEYDLDGLFVRLAFAVDAVGAKRIVLDTVESLFSSLPNEALLRSELRRLFRWMKDRGLTAVVTGERGDGTLTRYGLEEYVSDCVIELKHEVRQQISSRHLRILKYRGSSHGSNEYPFLIGDTGISVVPITSVGLDYAVSDERISTGIPRLDNMLGDQGYFKGSSVLVSGGSGTGKTSVAAAFASSVCRSGGRCVYIAFEESPSQIVRNMASINLNLQPHVDSGRLKFVAERPTAYEMERHLLVMEKLVREFDPQAVVIDPISNLQMIGSDSDVRSLLTRFVDYLKGHVVTVLFTDLTGDASTPESTESGISSIMDTWVLLRNIETGGERNRGLYVLKSRGMAHSNQVREFSISDEGVDLLDVAVGADGILIGSARYKQELMDRAEKKRRDAELERRTRERERKRAAVEAQIKALQAELAADSEDYESAKRESAEANRQVGAVRSQTAARRQGTRRRK